MQELHNDLSFLPERIKIKKNRKAYLKANLHNKTGYVICICNLKQVLILGLILEKVYRVIKFDQNATLKPHIDMNTKLRKKAKSDFEKRLT